MYKYVGPLISFNGEFKEPNYIYRRNDGTEVLCYAESISYCEFKVKTLKSNNFTVATTSGKLKIIVDSMKHVSPYSSVYVKIEKEKENKMTNSKTHAIAIALMEEDYQTVEVKLSGSDNSYTYLAERKMNLKPKDKVVVQGKVYARGGGAKLLKDQHPSVSVGVVVSVSDDIDIDIDVTDIKYTVILGKFKTCRMENFLTKLDETDKKVSRAIRRDRIESVLKNIKL